MRILVLNGPNLNTLGRRDPTLYGTDTLADIERRCRMLTQAVGAELEFRQSNHEGELVDWIQQARDGATGGADGIVINAGAYSHTSLAIHDALEYAARPTVEVHLSNVYRREEFRHTSFISRLADAVIAGAGARGYEFAVTYLLGRCGILPEPR